MPRGTYQAPDKRYTIRLYDRKVDHILVPIALMDNHYIRDWFVGGIDDDKA